MGVFLEVRELSPLISLGSVLLCRGHMDFMGGGPSSFHWFRPCVNAVSMAPVSPIFSSIMLKE